MKRQIAFALACLVSVGASAACYTVYQADGKVVYQSDKTPVNLALPLHETVAVRFGVGAMLAFTTDFDSCRSIGQDAEHRRRGREDVESILANMQPYRGADAAGSSGRYGSASR